MDVRPRALGEPSPLPRRHARWVSGHQSQSHSFRPSEETKRSREDLPRHFAPNFIRERSDVRLVSSLVARANAGIVDGVGERASRAHRPRARARAVNSSTLADSRDVRRRRPRHRAHALGVQPRLRRVGRDGCVNLLTPAPPRFSPASSRWRNPRFRTRARRAARANAAYRAAREATRRDHHHLASRAFACVRARPRRRARVAPTTRRKKSRDPLANPEKATTRRRDAADAAPRCR